MLRNKRMMKSITAVLFVSVIFFSQVSIFGMIGTGVGIGTSIDVQNTLNGAPTNAPRNSPQRERQSAVAERRAAANSSANQAWQNVKDSFDEIISYANNNQTPSKEVLDEMVTLLKSSRTHLKQFDDSQLTDYYLLTAWTEYYLDNLQAAYSSSAKAVKADPTNADAYNSSVIFSLLAGKKPDEPDETMDSMKGNLSLDFGAGDLRFDLLEETIPEIKSRCFNSTTFSYQPGKTAIAMLLWKLPDESNSQPVITITPDLSVMRITDPNSNDPNNTSLAVVKKTSASKEIKVRTAATMSQNVTQGLQNFADLCAANYDNENITFLSVNTDQTQQMPEVIEIMRTSPSLSASIAARDPRSSFPQVIDIDTEYPTLVLTDKAGKIIYAGPIEGTVTAMMLQSVGAAAPVYTKTKATLPQGNSQLAMNNASPANSSTRRNNTTTRPTNNERQTTTTTQTNTYTQAPNQGPELRTLPLEEQIQAEKLLNNAKGVFIPAAGKGFLTPTRGIEMCRQIMADYPNTEYALEAQRLLREKVNPRYRERYNLTDEELGITE